MLHRTTDDLMNVLVNLQNQDQLDSFLTDQETNHNLPPFHEYYSTLDKVRQSKKADLMRASGIERSYFYQLIDGRKQPGRDKVIALGLAASLSLKEILRCLELAHQPLLYSRDKRDSILIFAIQNAKTVAETNDLLFEYGESILS